MQNDAQIPRDDATHPEHETFGHEADHSNARLIALAVAGLASLAVGAVIVVWGISILLDPPEKRDLLTAPEPITPRPAIQGALNPRQPEALNQLRASEEMRLSTYGWVHREAEVVHIPIDRAMQLIVERGVPDWPTPTSSGAVEARGEEPTSDQETVAQ